MTDSHPQPYKLPQFLCRCGSRALRGIVEDERREIDWLFDTTRRNRILISAYVMDEKVRHGFAAEVQAADSIARNDPEFSRRSVLDFDRIIAALDSLPGR